MTKEYSFNPEEFGYEPLENFPELKGFFGPTTFIKVIATGSKEMMGRPVYWYSACYSMRDDHWKFFSSVYDASQPTQCEPMHTTYFGLISSYEFAVMLLKHIFGTAKQSSVEVEGSERLSQNINKERLS